MAEEQDILLREIDEELKQESLQKIWRKYSTLIIGTAFLLVACVAGYKGWQVYELNNRVAIGERFSKAQDLLLSKKMDSARDSFSKISKDPHIFWNMETSSY